MGSDDTKRRPDDDAAPPKIVYAEDEAQGHEKITTWFDTTATRAGVRRSPHVFVVGGSHSVGMLVPVWDGMTMGRGLTCDIFLSEGGVSRKHARFRVGDAGEVLIEDIGSSNGICLIGTTARITGLTVMHEGDRFQVGDVTVMLVNIDRRTDDLGDSFRKNLLRSATEDPATGLLSGPTLVDAVARQYRFTERYGVPLLAVGVEVSPLDVVEQTHGASAVAFVLRRVAAAMSVSTLLSQDVIVGRYAPTQLVAILPGTSAENASATAEWIRSSATGARIIYDGQRIPIGVRVGFASTSEQGVTSGAALLERAIASLQRAAG